MKITSEQLYTLYVSKREKHLGKNVEDKTNIQYLMKSELLTDEQRLKLYNCLLTK